MEKEKELEYKKQTSTEFRQANLHDFLYSFINVLLITNKSFYITD